MSSWSYISLDLLLKRVLPLSWVKHVAQATNSVGFSQQEHLVNLGFAYSQISRTSFLNAVKFYDTLLINVASFHSDP